jgi:hypothetical protein
LFAARPLSSSPGLHRKRDADPLSDEKVSFELLGSRVLMLTAEVRDLQLRFGALEQRFGALEGRLGVIETRLGGMENRLGGLESRFAGQEERMTRMLALLVRVAERLDGGVPG